jgi:hypothetical protein
MEKDTKKPVIRAVIAALFLLAGTTIFALLARKPIKAVAGAGDVYLTLNRGLAIEGLLFDSDLYESLTKGGDETAKYLFSLDEARKLFREQVGGYFDFIGFNYRVASAFSEDGAIVIAINPGMLALFGGYVFRRAGFEDVSSGVLRKGDMAFVSESGLWIIGNSAGIEKYTTSRGVEEKEKKKLWSKLTGEIDYDEPVNLILLSNGIARISRKILGEDFLKVLEDWASLSVWEGAVVDIRADKKELAMKMKIFPNEAPISEVFSTVGEENNLTRWLVSQAGGGGILSVSKPASLWRKAKDAYSDRPAPREFMRNLEEELHKEIAVDVVELADNLRDELAFINLDIEGKNHTILLAGAKKGLKEYLKKKESDITGAWRSVFKVSEIRYMKRFLAYTIMDDELIIASEPDILGFYLEGIKSGKNKPRELMKILEKHKNDSLSFAGILVKESQSATAEKKVNSIYYGAGFKKEGEKIIGEITLRGIFGDETKPTFKCRIWMIISWLMSSIFVMAMVYALSALAFNITLVRRMKKADL